MSLLSYENVLTGIIFLPCVYMMKKLFSSYVTLKKQYRNEELFYERHNCTVMYNRKYITGWPPELQVKIDTKNLDKFLEPLLYFINTAKYNLDLCVMVVGLNPLIDALHKAVERGVKVKIIVNFLSVKSYKEKYLKLMKSGVKVTFYIDKSEKLNYIMHCKYIVKDYDGISGFLCMGSMNLTGMTTILNNYEDVTFTSNINVVGAFYRNFQDSWNMISEDNQNIYNKTVLADSGFIV